MTSVALERLFDNPAEAGRQAQAARSGLFGRRVAVRGIAAHPVPAAAAIVRGGEILVDLPEWSQGQVASDRSQATGAMAQGLTTMADATGANGQGPADMSLTTGLEGHGAGDRQSPAPAGVAARHGDPGWPPPTSLRPGDRLIVQVDHARLGAYFAYLSALAAAAPAGLGFAPVCARAGGLFRLHLIAAARIALPAGVRVEARHDLMGIRLAQVALGFGADTLAGPLAVQRKLPLAGVPRPDEATPAGLAALIERAGLEPVLDDLSPETLP